MMPTSNLHSRRKKVDLSNNVHDHENKTIIDVDDSFKKEKVSIRRSSFYYFIPLVFMTYCLQRLADQYPKEVIDIKSLSITGETNDISTNRTNSKDIVGSGINTTKNNILRNQSFEETYKTNGTSHVLSDEVDGFNQVDERNKIVNRTKPYKFAYAFLMAGCDPKRPSYMGYIYNAVVSKEILRVFNSTADVIMLVRMRGNTLEERLPDIHVSLLTKSGIIVKYLQKPKVDTFHTAMMDKFRILEMTEYDRILYLDSDLMPLNNLDYIFEKSVGHNAPLQENVVLAYTREPANGGFFMLKPDKEDYRKISKIIGKMNRRKYRFDSKIGFGHEIVTPDYWESIYKRETTWDFYGAFTDQGLLYHWVKYEKKKFSAIIGQTVKSFDKDENGNVALIRKVAGDTIFNDIHSHSHLKPILNVEALDRIKPYQDFQHFFQETKPWFKSVTRPPIVERIEETTTPLHLWYHMLRKTNHMYNLGINPERFRIADPPLGIIPHINMVNKK